MRAKGLAGSIPLALILVVAPSVCRATDISGQSSSFAFSAALTGSDFRWVVDPTPWSTGSAPSPYSFSNDLSAFASGTAGQASVTTGALDATVASTVDGTAGIKSTSASSYADGLTFELGGNVVVFSANVVATNALSVQGDYGSLNVNGYADFSGASLSVFGTPY